MSRQRLLDQLSDGPVATLILIVASAGSGKTTLAVQWPEHISWPIAWLSLDEADNDPTVFVSYRIAARQTALPRDAFNVELRTHQPQIEIFDASWFPPGLQQIGWPLCVRPGVV